MASSNSTNLSQTKGRHGHHVNSKLIDFIISCCCRTTNNWLFFSVSKSKKVGAGCCHEQPVTDSFLHKWLLQLSCFSGVRLYATLWTAAHQAPLSTGFSRQEYWNGLPFPSPRETSNSALLTTPKPLTMWITTNCGKFLKRWEYHLRSPHTTVDLSQKAEKQPFWKVRCLIHFLKVKCARHCFKYFINFN